MEEQTIVKPKVDVERELDPQVLKLFEHLQEQVGVPEIREITKPIMRLASFFEKIVRRKNSQEIIEQLGFLLKSIEPNQQTVDELRRLRGTSSPWAQYAVLNLFGEHKKDEEAPNFSAATRFSHFAVVEHQSPDFAEKLAQAFRNTINLGFPWANSDVKFFDPRMMEVKDAVEKAEAIPVITHKSSSLTRAVKMPALIDLRPKEVSEEGVSAEAQELLRNQIDYRPFVIIRVPLGEPEKRSMIIMIANHQYLDGVPAAYHLHQALEASNGELEESEPYGYELSVSDQIEAASVPEAESYLVRTIELESDTVEMLNTLYEMACEKNSCKIGFFDFLQIMLLANFGVNGEEIKGGILAFDIDHTKQLDHFNIGDARALAQAVISGDKEALQPWIDIERDRIDLYQEGSSNMSVLNNLRHLPEALQARLNVLAGKLKIAQGISGQVLISVVPDKIRNIKLSGFGGPALTDFQDVAVTAKVNFVKGSRNKVASIFLRVKMKKRLDN
ncbi:MAG: hypothetical protein U9O78_02000 [Patescibacteria group bacterium]|nr:hypothetical protein [Patescibacteria group bacterium]